MQILASFTQSCMCNIHSQVLCCYLHEACLSLQTSYFYTYQLILIMLIRDYIVFRNRDTSANCNCPKFTSSPLDEQRMHHLHPLLGAITLGSLCLTMHNLHILLIARPSQWYEQKLSYCDEKTNIGMYVFDVDCPIHHHLVSK